MANGSIMLNYEEVEQVCVDMRKAKDEFEQQLNTLRSIVSLLNKSWDSDVKVRYTDDFKNVVETPMSKIFEYINDYARDLDDYVKRHREADEDLNRRLA